MKKRFALYGMFAAMAIFVTACGDDSSSSASAPEDEEYSSFVDDEESSSSEEAVSSSSAKKDGKSSSSEAKKDDKSSSSEKATSSSSEKKDGKSSSSEKAKSSSSAKDDKSSSSEKPESSSSEPESSSSEPESSSSEDVLVSVAPFCEVSVDEKNSEKLSVKYGVGTFSLSILFDTGDKASVYLKRKGETCSQIMSISGESYNAMPGITCKVTDCSETDGIATYIEDCEVDKETSGMPTADILKGNYDENCKYMIKEVSKEAPTDSLNKEMLSADKYGVMVDMRQDARYVEGEDFYPYVYRTIKVGDQTWMAQNMDYAPSSGSSCYDESDENCETYGRLYTWDAAQDACPDGWRLPTTTEWNDLLMKTMGADSAIVDVGMTMVQYSTAGVSLLGGDSHANMYGLSFVLGGAYGNPGAETLEYTAFGKTGIYWLDDGDEKVSMAFVSYYGEDEQVRMVPDLEDSQMQFSVRCVKDAK